ncbi:hypothetical protein C8J57DRAFT_1468406 [Mycena rebaudengoi]|nr:hypothetical protein C8J57DRAFT_1468406 [Mycena rebaudengoi]
MLLSPNTLLARSMVSQCALSSPPNLAMAPSSHYLSLFVPGQAIRGPRVRTAISAFTPYIRSTGALYSHTYSLRCTQQT